MCAVLSRLCRPTLRAAIKSVLMIAGHFISSDTLKFEQVVSDFSVVSRPLIYMCKILGEKQHALV